MSLVHSITILEPHCSGHRMQYVRWVARGAVAEGFNVQLATFSQSLDHPLYAIMQEECQHRIQPILLPDHGELSKEALLNQSGLLGLIRRELTYHRLYLSFFRRLPREERPDFIFLPYLDYFTYAAAVLGSPFETTPWGGIAMRPSFHLEPMGIPGPRSMLDRPKEKLFVRLLKNRTLRTLFSIDEPLVRYVEQTRPELMHRLKYLADPAELRGTASRESARQMLGIPGEAVVVLVYGSLTLRKGIEPLLRATQQSSFPSEVHLLLAGRQDSTVKSLLRSHQAESLRSTGRLHEHDSFLSDEEEYAAFRASDIVWMGYKGHYTMSGILVQAGMMGLPVVACSEGIIGWLTREHNLGSDVEVDDAVAVAKAVSTLTRSSDITAAYGESARRFAAAHTPDDFYKTIVSQLKTIPAHK